MKKNLFALLLMTLLVMSSHAQDSFLYRVELEPVVVPNLPGMHSFAYAQHDGKWLILGGRLDGIHARQPFNAFPENQNNKEAFVIDYENQTFWSANLDVLPVSIFEQMQSTNMNFYQVEDTLYFIGGYAYSNTEQDHITFSSMTTIIVSEVMNAIMNAGDITPFFKQIDDDIFALTGGQMGKMDGKLMIIGGHRFDGRYNPMGHATYVQSYSNAIRTFEVNNAGTQLSFSNYSEVIDPVHLRRRDYNLLPQIFEDATMGYTISSGVFQETIDLPFLYPVDIKPSGHTPNTSFNQYLSNYHGSKVAIHDAVNNQTHNLFFGGMSQYYYDNGTLVQDDQVPFVKTISRLSRYSDGSLQEFVLPVEMPALKGASSEFIMNLAVPHHEEKIIKLNEAAGISDTILVGHIVGGILSPTLNPFSNNVTETTSADASIYAVKLIYDASLSSAPIEQSNPHTLSAFPNPVKDKISLEMNIQDGNWIEYHITSVNGQVVQIGEFEKVKNGTKTYTIKLNKNIAPQQLFLTVSVDNVYFFYEKLIKE